MVLQNLVGAKRIKKIPSKSFILGFIYAAIAIILAYFIFPEDPSISIIFLTTLAALPLLIDVLTLEEEEGKELIKKTKKRPLIKEHMDVFMIFTWMFFGFMLCYLAVYVAFPFEFSNLLFSKQIETIASIVGSGFFNGSNLSGAVISSEGALRIIMINNFKVLLFCVLFSFLYGAGAIFVLAWNASILAVAMGNFIKREIAYFVEIAGFTGIQAYFYAGTFGIARYMIHGLPEIAAYFLGAIAGGIISAAVIKTDHKSPMFYDVLLDSLDLIAVASLLIIVAALIEVGITPRII